MTTPNLGAICATAGLFLILVSKLSPYSKKSKAKAARRKCSPLPVVVPGNDLLGITHVPAISSAREGRRANGAKDTTAGHDFIWSQDCGEVACYVAFSGQREFFKFVIFWVGR